MKQLPDVLNPDDIALHDRKVEAARRSLSAEEGNLQFMETIGFLPTSPKVRQSVERIKEREARLVHLVSEGP